MGGLGHVTRERKPLVPADPLGAANAVQVEATLNRSRPCVNLWKNQSRGPGVDGRDRLPAVHLRVHLRDLSGLVTEQDLGHVDRTKTS